jgi:hypothetical protein
MLILIMEMTPPFFPGFFEESLEPERLIVGDGESGYGLIAVIIQNTAFRPDGA